MGIVWRLGRDPKGLSTEAPERAGQRGSGNTVGLRREAHDHRPAVWLRRGASHTRPSRRLALARGSRQRRGDPPAPSCRRRRSTGRRRTRAAGPPDTSRERPSPTHGLETERTIDRRSAKTLASLNHPHIAGFYGLEESAGVTALVMELVEGEDLSQRIARGAIPLRYSCLIALRRGSDCMRSSAAKSQARQPDPRRPAAAQ